MKIAVLFDGAGLARLGLEQAGHECIGVELDPVAHYLGQFVGSGECCHGDVHGLKAEGLIEWLTPYGRARRASKGRAPERKARRPVSMPRIFLSGPWGCVSDTRTSNAYGWRISSHRRLRTTHGASNGTPRSLRSSQSRTGSVSSAESIQILGHSGNSSRIILVSFYARA